MPFIGKLNQERVIPEQVPDKTTVVCPSCGGDMRPRRSSTGEYVRHFFHLNDPNSCAAGESAEHKRMKSLAVSKLRDVFSGQYSHCGPEVSLDVSDTRSGVNKRIADSAVRFEEQHPLFKSCLIIEIQFKNKGKSILETTRDYLKKGYSVFWAYPKDFSEEEFKYERLEQGFSTDSNLAYLPSDLNRVGEFTERDLSWSDPVPGCDHQWKEMNGFQFCVRCRINRTYSTAQTRFLYDNIGFLGPTDRDDIASVEPFKQDKNCDIEAHDGYGSSKYPHEVPEECTYGDHEWMDYGWADQGKASCKKCSIKIWKEDLPSRELNMMDEF